MMRKWLAAAIPAAFLLPAAQQPALAGGIVSEQMAGVELASCTTLADLQGAVMTMDAQIVGMFEGDQAQAWLDAYNALPPRTDFSANLVVLIQSPAQSNTLVMLLREDCVVAAWGESTDLVERLNAAILGQSV